MSRILRIRPGCREVIAAATLLAAAASPTLAGDGAVPVYGAMTITESGVYRLTRDVVSSASPVLVIDAPDVTLDLGGHLLAARALDRKAIEITAAVASVSIEGGTLRAQLGIVGTGLTSLDLSLSNVDFQVEAHGGAVDVHAAALTLHAEGVRTRCLGTTCSGIEARGGEGNPGAATVRNCVLTTVSSIAAKLDTFAAVRFERNTIHADEHIYNSSVARLIGDSYDSSVLMVRDNEVVADGDIGFGFYVMDFNSIHVEGNSVVGGDTAWYAASVQRSLYRANTFSAVSKCLCAGGLLLVEENVLGGCENGLYLYPQGGVYRGNLIAATTPVYLVSGTIVDGGGNVEY